MIDPAVLKRLLALHKDAQYGYCVPTVQEFYQYVKVLLQEIDVQAAEIARLTALQDAATAPPPETPIVEATVRESGGAP